MLNITIDTPHLYDRFERIAATYSDRIAIEDEDGNKIRYEELRARADRLSRVLRAAGVSNERFVVLCAERGIEAIVAMLAILKAGGAYIPIDPAYPSHRVALILENSGATIAVSTPRSRRVVDGFGIDVIVESEADRAEAIETEHSHDDASSAAYVIYTSGSTGKPKGVVVEHRNIVRLITEHAVNLFECGPSDVWLWYHSIGFDFSVWEIWGALLLGGTLVIASLDTIRSPQRTVDLVRRSGVTVLNQTPSAFRQFARADLGRRTRNATLRLVIFGGERLEPALLEAWIDAYGDEQPRLINMYGITETTVHVTHKSLRRADVMAADGDSPIGVPLPDLRIQLLNEELQAVRDGEVGEIVVCGAGVARGYANAPDLTSDRFIENADGTRSYRSGDLARYVDGELFYHGRSDQQLKVRGFRIEPGEVEAVLESNGAVERAVVRAKDYGDGDVRLIAYVVPSPQADAQITSTLKQHAHRHLPSYMQPSAYAVLPEIPLTVNGKVDVAELERLSAATGAAPTRARNGNEVEDVVVREWLAVLGPEADLTADFFECGGTSLALIRMLGRINEALAISIDPQELKCGVTVEKVASATYAALRAVA